MIKKALLTSALLLSLQPYTCSAVMNSGWSISSSYVWRLLDSHDNTFNNGSPAKILQIDRTVMHRQAVFTVQRSLTNKYSFKTGCMYQSATPAFELDVPALDISMNDTNRGYVFARFLVDKGQEYSMRGQIVPPSRIIFAPFTKSQQKKLSDLFLQIGEGGQLHIALLQGMRMKPRVYSVPLEGFFDISDKILSDCSRLNKMVQNYNGTVTLLPDYLTKEPEDASPKGFSLKPKMPNDGLTPIKNEVLETSATDPLSDLKTDKEEDKVPEVQVFTPGGGVASIGDDGKPIGADAVQNKDSQDSDNLGKAKPMTIGDDGKPVPTNSN